VSVDVIQLRGLRAMGICGALPEEQVRPQPIELDVDVSADLAEAGSSDALTDTIDYADLVATAERVVTLERFALLERLAARVAEEILRDERVLSVTVSARKLRPPVPQQLATAGVRITRTSAG
jgi:dihydroneopterin aldolase